MAPHVLCGQTLTPHSHLNSISLHLSWIRPKVINRSNTSPQLPPLALLSHLLRHGNPPRNVVVNLRKIRTENPCKTHSPSPLLPPLSLLPWWWTHLRLALVTPTSAEA